MIDLVHIMIAFTSNMETPNAPATYYSTTISSPLNITKNALYCTVTLISDGLIVGLFYRSSMKCRIHSCCVKVYRLFVVWGYNYYVTILPLLALFGELGTQHLPTFYHLYVLSLYQVPPYGSFRPFIK